MQIPTTLRLRLLGATLAIAASTTAHAGVFDTADGLFAARDGNSANVGAARAEYHRLLPTVSGADLAYAVQQIGRLALYEGDYLLSADSANNVRRASLFDDCQQMAAKLEGQAAFVTQYAYWRLSCTAQWMKYASVSDRLQQLAGLRRYFDQMVTPDLEVATAMGIDGRYQGGGLERVLSGIYANQLGSLIRSTLPNGAKALDMANRALASRPYPGDVNAGADYYRNYRYKAEALQFLGKTADAAAAVQAAIDEITERSANGELPVGLEPETKGELQLLQVMHVSLVEP